MALKDALSKAKMVILEPVMKVEVTTPTTYLGEVLSDLSAERRDPGY